jgi:hypothetical protein
MPILYYPFPRVYHTWLITTSTIVHDGHVRSCRLNIKKWRLIRFDGLSKEGDRERMDLGDLRLGHFVDFDGLKLVERTAR